MHLTPSAARRLLLISSCCAAIVTCALVLSPRHGMSSLCSAPQKCASLALPDDSAEVAAAKANIEHEAFLRHQKIQDSMDHAQALGDSIAARMRLQAAAFFARMRREANATIGDSPHSSASFHPLNFRVALLWACCILAFW
jgi:hypothetical protein